MSMRNIYRKIAKKYGVSTQSVKEEMQTAITGAYTDPSNKDGITNVYQSQIPAKDEIPTPEEFIRYAANAVKEKQ